MTTSPASKKVLVIDDEPDVVTYLETLLQDHGYQTVSARDGEEGLTMARSEKPDLICLDISMPEKSGVRLYREVRGDPELESVPVVVVTGVTGYGGDPGAFERFLGSRSQVPPPNAFVPKPIDRDKLLATISELLADQ
jgi:CheY-like chemotaxis protein